MSDVNNPNDAHRQRVLNHALSEVVGGQSPPDLSQRILKGLTTTDISNKERAMSESKGTSDGRGRRRTRKGYLLAIAASLLIVAGAVYLGTPSGFWSAREMTRSDTVANRLPATEGDRDLWASAAPSAETPRLAARSTPKSTEPQADFDTLVELITSNVESDSWEEASGRGQMEGFPTNLSIKVSQSQTVHDGTRQDKVNPVADLVLPIRDGQLNGQLNGKIVFPDEPPIAYPDRKYWKELAARRKKFSDKAGASEAKSLRMMVTPRIVIQEEEELQTGLDDAGVDGDLGAGRGPGQAGDRYDRIVENPFLTVVGNPLSTFSIDVDTASYANVRQYLTQSEQLPPPDAVRIEELVNYFGYDYTGPDAESETPFAAHMEVTGCPWQPKHRLLKIGIKGREIPDADRPPSNLVFLIDVSGSMDESNKLPLVVRGLKALAGQLGENDRVAIVVYASAEGLVLDSTPGTRAREIINVLDQLDAGGSTNGGAGIELAYRIAEDHFIQHGTNRVILCTDGDFNVGTTSTADLERLAEEKAKSGVFLTVLGFGRGNLNDQMMETISGRGNGNYYYVDSDREARKVLVEEMGGTLVTIAKDVKIQIEFNPAAVAAYRLVGYENRILAKEDFNDDTKDAGEIGAGHTVTAIYELIPAGEEDTEVQSDVDPLKYQQPAAVAESSDEVTSGELLTLKLRYKAPDGDTSRLLTFPLADAGESFGQANEETKFATAVAMFGMLLRDSRYRGNTTYDAIVEIAEEGIGQDKGGYRAEFVELVRRAKALSGP